MNGPRPAGFWLRAVAAMVDLTLFALVRASFGYAAGRLGGGDADDALAFESAVTVFTLLFTAAYTSVLHALAGQTVGKLLVGARVVGDDGQPPTLGAALLRYLGYYASAAVFMLGFVMAGLRRDKRALHDLLAGTRVERVRPARRRPLPPLAPRPADSLSPPVAPTTG